MLCLASCLLSCRVLSCPTVSYPDGLRQVKSGDYTIYVHIIEARDLKAEDVQARMSRVYTSTTPVSTSISYLLPGSAVLYQYNTINIIVSTSTSIPSTSICQYQYIPVPVYTSTSIYQYQYLPVPVYTSPSTYQYQYLPVPVSTSTSIYQYQYMSVPVPVNTGPSTYRYQYIPLPVYTSISIYHLLLQYYSSTMPVP